MCKNLENLTLHGRILMEKGLDESRAVFLVDWELVDKLFSLARLELSNLGVCNRALLAQILWWFPCDSFYIRL